MHIDFAAICAVCRTPQRFAGMTLEAIVAEIAASANVASDNGRHAESDRLFAMLEIIRQLGGPDARHAR